jgi:hypothetical protein
MGGLGGLGPTNVGSGMFERKKENEITVGKSGADFTTIEAALAVAVAGDTILVSPGVYVENNPLTLVANVSLVSTGGLTVTNIVAANANQDLFTSADVVDIKGFGLLGVSGTGWIVRITAAHRMFFSEYAIFNCSNGIGINHASAVVDSTDLSIGNDAGTLAIGMRNNAGRLTVSGGLIAIGSTVTTMFDLDGANAVTTIENMISFESGVTTMVLTDNDARSVFTSCEFVGMIDGVVAQGGADIRLVGCSIFNAQQDGVRIPAVGSGTNVVGQGLTLEDSVRFDVNALCATCVFSGYGKAELDKMSFVSGSENYFLFVDLKEGDEGTNILGELHIGRAEKGDESVFGEGESYTREMLVYTRSAGNVYVDVSAAARSASGSTFTFPGVAANNMIYVASSLANGGDFLQHFGIKVSQTVAAVLGGGSIAVEAWTGAAWVSINHMSADANPPDWNQYAKAIFERTGSEQVRYEQAFLSTWTKNDDPSVGTNYYWVRFRIVGGITTAPTFEQFKLHPSRSEKNIDGTDEFFGASRPVLPLIAHINLATAVVGSAPGNASIAFTATTTLSLTRNQFSNNAVDSFGQVITIPVGLDTSIPVTVEDVWFPDTVNAGDVELRAIPGQLEVGDLFDGSVADGATLADINTVAGGSRYQSRKTSFDIDVSDLIPGDFLVVRIERDATVGNDPPDTLSGNIIHAEFGAFGKAWKA